MVAPVCWIVSLAPEQGARVRARRDRFHDLRHSHATAMLASNIHPKIVSERLGHSRVALNVVPGMQEEAAAAIDAAFGAALNKRG
jgi:integrase